MPRRAAAVRRETTPDAKYNNRLVAQLINKVLLDGKKSLAENIVNAVLGIQCYILAHHVKIGKGQ